MKVKGFTLQETLVALILLLLVTTLTSLVIRQGWGFMHNRTERTWAIQELQLMDQQIRKDIFKARFISHRSRGLLVFSENDSLVYQLTDSGLERAGKAKVTWTFEEPLLEVDTLSSGLLEIRLGGKLRSGERWELRYPWLLPADVQFYEEDRYGTEGED